MILDKVLQSLWGRSPSGRPPLSRRRKTGYGELHHAFSSKGNVENSLRTLQGYPWRKCVKSSPRRSGLCVTVPVTPPMKGMKSPWSVDAWKTTYHPRSIERGSGAPVLNPSALRHKTRRHRRSWWSKWSHSLPSAPYPEFPGIDHPLPSPRNRLWR